MMRQAPAAVSAADVRARVVALVLVAGIAIAACGETRRPIGEECVRSDDCLSGVCSDKTCVAAPTLVTGGGASPPDEVPRVPIVDGGPTDAGAGGG